LHAFTSRGFDSVSWAFLLFTVNVIRQMAPLFSKVDLNKLWQDVQNEETLICAKFGKDLFNISKVIGRKKWPSFFDSQCSSRSSRVVSQPFVPFLVFLRLFL